MRVLKVLAAATLGTILFLLCSAEHWHSSSPDNSPDAASNPADEIVFTAKHYRTKGPCIKIENGWAMPIIEGFKVTNVASGKLLRIDRVQVRPLSRSTHLAGLGDGETCTLRLVPSRDTSERLRRDDKTSADVLWVDGDEIRVERRAN